MPQSSRYTYCIIIAMQPLQHAFLIKVASSIKICYSSISNSFHKNVKLPSIHYDMLAHLCNFLYVILVNSSDKTINLLSSCPLINSSDSQNCNLQVNEQYYYASVSNLITSCSRLSKTMWWTNSVDWRLNVGQTIGKLQDVIARLFNNFTKGMHFLLSQLWILFKLFTHYISGHEQNWFTMSWTSWECSFN